MIPPGVSPRSPYTVLAPAWETLAFQAFGTSFGTISGLMWATIGFTAAHFIVKWLVEAWVESKDNPMTFARAFRNAMWNSVQNDKGWALFLLGFSLIVTLPFLNISFINLCCISISVDIEADRRG